MSEERLSPTEISNLLAREVASITRPAAADRVAALPADWCWHCGAVCKGHELKTPKLPLIGRMSA